MNSLLFLLAPVALLLPAVVELPVASDEDDAANAAEEPKIAPLAPMSAPAAPFRILQEAIETPLQRQVRIEQRVIIRISPSSSAARQAMLAELPRRPLRNSFQEERLDDCVKVDGIAGVQPVADNRLLLFMRDRRVLSAALERSCNASDFYAGFYVERHQDGQLCPDRDRLQSRAGASCEVAQLSRLVAMRD